MGRLRHIPAILAFALLLSACSNPNAFQFRVAVVNLSNDLMTRFSIGRAVAPITQIGSAGAERDANLLVFDPFVDGISGEQTRSSVEIHDIMVQTIQGRAPNLRIAALSADTSRRAGYALVGTMRAESHPTQGRLYRLYASIIDMRTGATAASADAWVADTIPSGPVGFYRRAPMFMADNALDIQVAAATGTSGGGTDYIHAIDATATTADGEAALEAKDYKTALMLFNKSSDLPGERTMKNLYGKYQALYDSNRRADAGPAFYDLVTLAVSRRNVSYARFLFNPGSTEFLQATDVQEYNLWLRQFARYFAAHGTCVIVVGNASNTGEEPRNVTLSANRAERIKSILVGDDASLARRLSTVGRGSAECRDCRKVDSETTDIDRRVEFQLAGCT
jgi:outer membrane protein OmpA-like peptidoglycan-associated protein